MSKVAEMSTAAGKLAVEPRVKAFLAGHSGSGKTESACTIPGRKLLVDVDNRAETVAGREDVSIIACHSADPRSIDPWNKLEGLKKSIIADIKAGDFPFDAIIFDGLTAMGRYSMNWALLLDSKRGLGGAPAQQHYLPQMDALARFVISSLSLPVHVIYTGHLELHEDGDGGNKLFLPKITGKLRTEAGSWFNETYLCYRIAGKEGKTEYFWQTAGDGKYEFFKSSLNQRGRFWNDPIPLDFKEPLVGFADLLNRRFGKEGGDAQATTSDNGKADNKGRLAQAANWEQGL